MYVIQRTNKGRGFLAKSRLLSINRSLPEQWGSNEIYTDLPNARQFKTKKAAQQSVLGKYEEVRALRTCREKYIRRFMSRMR
jgi:hypothetical protein